MKLVKIFSDKKFKNTKFNEHYNIVLGNIFDTTHKKDTHNLGKTSLLVLIDFMLLCDFDKKSLLSDPGFKEQTFYLEIKLNDGRFLVIKRGLSEPTKISFKCADTSLADFTPPSEWDEERLSFSNAQNKLNDYLGFNILSEYKYRKSITYFLRSQKDYLDEFELGKFGKGKQSYWKPFVFSLLGFDGSLINTKLAKDETIEQKEKEISTLQKQANIDIAEKDKIIGLIDVKNEQKKKTELEIDKFNFNTQDSESNKELVERIDIELQALNTERYRLSREIEKTNLSLAESNSVVKFDKLKSLYEEVGLYFPDQLKKQFHELEQFTDSISTERKKYLSDILENYQKQISEVVFKIGKLQEERSDKLMLLTQADVYDKFKFYQKQLAEVESDIKVLEEKLRLVDKSASIKKEIESLVSDREKAIDNIRKAIERRAHADINRIFNQIITDVTGNNAILSIKQNKEGNVEFKADYQTLSNITTSEANGTSYKKLLCVAFDLSLLIYYSNKSFFKFVYHDGVMEGLDDRIKNRLLSTTQTICEKYGLQYILTIINSDIPRQTEGTIPKFPYESVCLELNDKDDEGKLFCRSF